jgi:TRAP-type C4-dicarboxylate transport system permease small subunit
MYEKLEKIYRVFDSILLKIQKTVVIAFGSFMAFALVGVIVGRTLFENPFLGTEEIVLITAMWFYMLGAAIAASERSHLKTDILQLFIQNPKVIAGVDVVISLFTLAVAVFMSYLCYDLLAWAVLKKTALPATRIPSYVPQSAFVVSVILICYYFVRDIVNDIKKLVGKS